MKITVFTFIAALTAYAFAKSSPDGTCGGRNGYSCVGSTSGDCCSQYGYCGKTSAYCGTKCNPSFGSCSGVASSSTSSTLASKIVVSPNGKCGGKTGFTCQGSSSGNCCSEYGYCGKSSAYCSKGCQAAWGTCSSQSSVKSSSRKPSTKSSSTKASLKTSSKTTSVKGSSTKSASDSSTTNKATSIEISLLETISVISSENIAIETSSSESSWTETASTEPSSSTSVEISSETSVDSLAIQSSSQTEVSTSAESSSTSVVLWSTTEVSPSDTPSSTVVSITISAVSSETSITFLPTTFSTASSSSASASASIESAPQDLISGDGCGQVCPVSPLVRCSQTISSVKYHVECDQYYAVGGAITTVFFNVPGGHNTDPLPYSAWETCALFAQSHDMSYFYVSQFEGMESVTCWAQPTKGDFVTAPAYFRMVWGEVAS